MSVLSMIVPCFNEEETVDIFYYKTKAILAQLNMEIEYLFIDDGSRDRTYAKLIELNKLDANVRIISFSRNFGKEAAIFSGLRASTGDCAVVIDADLQHPPETIIDMVLLWREGYEVIEGIKLNRGKESAFHKLFSQIFYSLISKIVGMDMKNSSDFKLLDRKVIDVLCGLRERDTFFRALSYWVGFKSTSIKYEVKSRVAGKTKWSFWSLSAYAVKNLLAFSYAPLHFIIVAGGFFLIIGAFFGIDALITFFHGSAVSGYPTIVLLITLSTGGIMLSLGIVGVYIAKILDEIKNRPQYIIRDKK